MKLILLTLGGKFMKLTMYIKIISYVGIIALCMLIASTANAQTQTKNIMAKQTWSYAYGGASYECPITLARTFDGDYVITGYSSSFGSGGLNFWVIKLDSSGNIIFQKTYGGGGEEYSYWIEQTNDGGYVVVGATASFGYGGYDLWILKLNSAGDIEWQKAYGTSITEYGWEIHQTGDGGYIVSGKSGSVSCTNCKVLVLKLDSSGNIIWQKTYGNAIWLDPASVQVTNDGYIITGNANTIGAGGFDFWVAKLDFDGNIMWQNAYGGPNDEFSNVIRQTDDGGYLVAGKTKSYGAGDFDAIVLKLDRNGAILWQKTYGGPNMDRVWALEKESSRFAACSGHILVADTASFGSGNVDGWLIKIDASGNIQWQKTYGGTLEDYILSLKSTTDGGYMGTGRTQSYGSGSFDYWVMKLDSSGNINHSCGLVQDTHIAAVDSHFITTPTNFPVFSVNLNVTNTNVSAIVSNAQSVPICSFLSQAQAEASP